MEEGVKADHSYIGRIEERNLHAKGVSMDEYKRVCYEISHEPSTM